MASPLTITIEQSRAFLPGDYAQIEVDSTVQSDRVSIWGGERASLGYGHGRYGDGEYGRGRSLGYGIGLYGDGPYGIGLRRTTHETGSSFVAGDYSVRARAVDKIGNAGSWSSAVTHRHRPTPPKPSSLSIASGTLNWAWSDPA